jgi:hypothetical protein
MEKPDVYDEIVQRCRTGISFFFSDTDAIANLNPSIKCKVFRTFSKFQPKNLGGTVAC